jgi:hypothetical protein
MKEAQPAGRVLLQGVDHYRVTDAMFESVRVVMSYRGEPYSTGYVQGISGMAFRLAGPCPCAPTCSAPMDMKDLIRLFGYEAEESPLGDKREQVDARIGEMIARVKEEIRAGRPALVWHAFTNAEWDVVCGFDDEKGLFYGRGSYGDMRGPEPVSADQKRAGTALDICPAFGAMFIGRKVGTFDARPAELAALKEAVRHARTPESRLAADPPDKAGKWRLRNGLGVYEWWVKNPPTSWDYCLDVTRSRRRTAPDFLREIAPRYPAAQAALLKAAEHFAAEADALDRCMAAATAKDPDTAERGRRAAEALSAAMQSYEAGIAEVEAALAVLEKEHAGGPPGPG